MNQPQVYICPLHPEPPSHLPPHSTLLVSHRAPDLSFLHHTANFHWLSILIMVIYVSPCYSLNSSHPLLALLCPQASSLCLHLHCCPANRLISIIFLDSIYMHYYMIFVSLFLTSLYIMGSRFIHLIRIDSDVFFLRLSIHSIVYVPHLLYPFIC